MEFWIDIEDSAGNKVGPGPITTAEGWQWSPRLDEAGTFRFRMPASDPAAAYLVEKRVVRCYAVIDGAVTALGAGVIDEVALDVGDPSMLEVSGPDLLAELSQVSVKQLRICEQAWTFLNDGRGSVHWLQTDAAGAQTDTDLQDTYDGDLYGPTDSIFLSHDAYPNIRYLYVGHDARFDRVRITMGTNVNDRETVLEGQYFDGSGWRDLSDLTDGTSGYIDWADHWATLNHSGEITFTRPTDWARCTPTTAAGNWFWVRFTVGEGTRTKEDPKQQIQEVEVYADVPTTNGINLIMQYAPPGWATSGYPATEAAHYIEFDGESILAALRVLVEHGGQDGSGNPIREHFRLGSGRTLTWLGTTLTDTGLRAVDADGIAAEGADEMCLIQHLSRKRDASGVVTRLYPFTADGIDLLLTTRSAPAGYTLVKGAPIPGQPWATASYLQRASTLGVIEGWARFQDVGMQQGDSYLVHPEMASNALFDRALEYLRTHGAPQEFYDLTIAQVPAIILPGSTIDVVYHEYVDGYHAVDIDTVADGEPLVILATTLEVDNSGAVTTALEVATIDRHAASDASVIAGSIRELRRIQGTTGGLSSHTTIHREASGTAAITGGFINGVTIDNSPIGQLVPSTGAFTAIAVTNDIAVGGTVDGVDISVHAANDSAHHSPVTVGNTGLSIAGQQVSLRLATVSGLELSSGLRLADSVAGDGLSIASKVLAVGAGDGISVGADTVAVRLASPAGLSFSGGALQLDDTVAGDGLSIASKVLAVGAGDGISVGADTVAVRLASPAGLSFSGGALQLDDTVAGDGLSIASKVLAVGAGDGISVGADTVAVRLASPAGLSFSGGALQLDDTVAGAGLGIANKVLNVALATNSGLQLSGSPAKLRLRTPSTLDSSSTNTVTDVLGHTHAVRAYSDLAIYPGQLAKADTSGDSTWHKITLTDRLRTMLIDSATGTSLTIAPAQDINLSPGGTARVRATSGVRLQADNYVSQTTGWAIGYNGAADFRYVYTDELHAKAFIADLEQALAGGQIISKSVAPLSRDFTAPAAGATAYLWVECFRGFPDAQVFAAGDVVMVRNFDRSGGGLDISNCFGTVSAPYIPSPQSDPPEQRWTFTRLSGTVNGHPAAGYMATGQLVRRGTLALDFGVSGNGYHEVNAIDGLMAENSPYDQNVKWDTHPWYDRLVVTRQGNLKGIFNVAGEYGLYAGTGVTDADKFLRVSNQAIEGHNLPIKLYDGANVTVALSPGTNPSIALGMPIPTGWLSQNGFWAGRHTDGTYRQYIGQVSGGALVKGASWDGQSYNVVGNLIVGPGVGYVVDNALLHLPFDGPLPYERDFHVDLSGHLGQKPTVASGGIIGRPGKFGKAVQLAEATTNLIGNPTMREPGWWAYAMGAGSITQEYRNDAAALGGKVLRATLSGCTSWTHFFRANGETLAPNTTYTVRFRLRASQARSIIFYVGRPDYPYSQYLGHGFSATTEWQEFSFTQTTPADTTNGYIYAIAAGTNPPDMWFELDYCQVEAKAYPTPIAEGSMGPGHAWTGTPYASSSTRGQGHLRYGSESLNLAAGTLSMWVRFPMPLPNAALTAYARLWEYGYYSYPVVNQWMAWTLSPSWNAIAFAIYNPETGAAYNGPGIPSTAFGDQQWHHFVVTWQDGALRTYLDGAMRSEVGCTTMKSARAYGWWSVPGHGLGTVSVDVDDLLILDRALTADEVRQLYTSGRPVTVTGSPHSLLLTGPGRGKVEGHAGGIFGWDGAAQPMWGFCNEDGVSFGGATLNAGDALIGDVAGGNYLQWDASAGTLTVRGTIVVQPGSSGLANMSDANLDNVADGATYKRTTANEKAGGARGYAGLDTSGNVARVIRGAAIAGGSAATGLNLTADYLGYYNGSSWPVYIANNGRFRFSADANNYVKWDGATFEVKGRVVITGGSGVASLSDAGALATKDQAGSADVTFNYAGSTSKGGNAKDTDNVSGTAASTIKSGAVRANAGLDTSGNVARVIRGAAIAGGSAATGLNLTADYLGYYNGSSWPVYIANNGRFRFSADANNYVKWDGSTFEVKGRVVITGGSGVASLSDAGALATKDQVGSADVTFNYAGSTSKGGNAKDTDNVSGTAASTIKSGAVRANAGLDSSGYVSRVIQGAAIAGGSAATGLNLTADYLGYYNGSSWPVYIANNGRFRFSADANNYVKWDGSTFEVKGRVVITGGSGVASLSDAGALATKDQVGSADVTFNYAGSTSKGGNAKDTDNVSGTAASTIKSGAVRANAGLDSSGYVSRVIQGAAIAGGSAATGLNLTADYLGYYDGTAFRTYLDKNGNFLFSSPGGASLLWSAATGKLQGRDSSNNVQWETDATTGAITAGGGATTIDSVGLKLLCNADNVWSGGIWNKPGSHIKFYDEISSLVRGGVVAGYNPAFGMATVTIFSRYNDTYEGGLELRSTPAYACQATLSGSLTINESLAVSGGLNLGTARGAGAGGVYASGTSAIMAQLQVNRSKGLRFIIDDDPTGARARIYSNSNNDMLFAPGAGSSVALDIHNSGRVLIGTTTDDGVNRLQVNGPSIFGAWMAADRAMVREIAAPPAISGWIQIFGDSADGDLKVRFPNGTIKTIQTN